MIIMEWINDQDFKKGISLLPLVSIDLLIKNDKDQYLLGLRINSPAKDYWFVPGGRIRRMENLYDAFERICELELGQKLNYMDTRLIGIFEHMYDDSYDSPVIGTHYISIGLEIKIDKIIFQKLSKRQHQNFKWFSVEEIMKYDKINNKTKEFFIDEFGIRPK